MEQSQSHLRPSTEESRSTKLRGIPINSLMKFGILTKSRRHRQRKTDYAKSLEDEIAQLERLHAVIVSESQCLSDENDAIKRLLHSQGLGSQVEEAGSWSSAISAGEASSADARMTKSSDTNETGHPQNSDNQRGPRWKELLNPSNPQIDSTSRDRIEQSQMLLLRDVKPFQ